MRRSYLQYLYVKSTLSRRLRTGAREKDHFVPRMSCFITKNLAFQFPFKTMPLSNLTQGALCLAVMEFYLL